MKKGNFIKKFMSPVLAASLLFGAAATAGAADNVSLLDPQEGDILIKNNTYVKDVVKDSNGLITGRTIDASGVTTTTTIGNVSANTFQYRTYGINDSGYVFDGGSARFKNNFTWQFDFCFESAPASATDGGFYMLFGSTTKWQNQIRFFRFSDTQYYIRWGSNDGNDAIISGASTGSVWAGSAYTLEAGKTYRMKIEVDARNDKMYVTFINPYVTVVGSTVTKLTAPEWDNPNIFTKTTSNVSTAPLGFVQTDIAGATDGTNRLNVLIQARAATKVTLSNEKFYIDRFWNTTPALTVENGTVTAATSSVNITNFNYYTQLPVLILGVYKENGTLVNSNVNNPYKNPAKALEENQYSTAVDVSSLEDGTYTVKAFVWNTLGKLQPYDNCLTQKTLTVKDGVAAFAE